MAIRSRCCASDCFGIRGFRYKLHDRCHPGIQGFPGEARQGANRSTAVGGEENRDSEFIVLKYRSRKGADGIFCKPFSKLFQFLAPVFPEWSLPVLPDRLRPEPSNSAFSAVKEHAASSVLRISPRSRVTLDLPDERCHRSRADSRAKRASTLRADAGMPLSDRGCLPASKVLTILSLRLKKSSPRSWRRTLAAIQNGVFPSICISDPLA